MRYMKVALINPVTINSEELNVKQNEPVSIQYLKSFLNQFNYECDCYDLRFITEKFKVIKKITEYYDVVGISVFYPYDPLPLASEIRMLNPSIIILLGGPGAKLNYKNYLQENSPVHFVIFNEGEEKLKLIMNYLDGKLYISELKGVAFRRLGKIVTMGNGSNIDIDAINFPVRDKTEINKYIPSIVSSRGCNGKCTFCSNSYMGKWRGRNYVSVVNEIEYLNKSLNQRYFQFVEPNFLGSNERGIQIAKEIIKRKLKVSFDLSCRIDSLINGKEVLIYLKKAGATRVLIGVENFYDSTLQAWKKGITIEEIIEAINFLKKIYLPYTLSLIIFHEDLNMKELEFNINIISSMKIADMIDNLFNRMVFYPGTELNRSNQIKEWDFKSNRIKEIYNCCISYKQSQLNHRIKLLEVCKLFETVREVDIFILNNIYYFQNIKAKELSILKYCSNINFCEEDRQILLYRKYSEVDLLFRPSKSISVSEEDDMYVFTNHITGFSYYTNQSAYLIYNFAINCTYQELSRKILTNFIDLKVDKYYKMISIIFQFVQWDILKIE